MFSRISLAAGAAAGGLVVFFAMQAVNAVWLLPVARYEGRAAERVEAQAATNKAIGELTNAADRARVNRRLCLERGWLYLNGTGQCVERATQPNG
ncbi:hypothetical protein [Ensifer sesbaniae]|uniref:hypothetical protein n=1 Tax=Ensifer sesbaniae TaxID=1214071 RepID=UPI00156A2F40|nr:hypothetical protein [Ensifer sesbaniae]